MNCYSLVNRSVERVCNVAHLVVLQSSRSRFRAQMLKSAKALISFSKSRTLRTLRTLQFCMVTLMI